MTARHSVWIGFDPREVDAYAVARSSARRHMTMPLQMRGVVLSKLQRSGLYTRPLEMRARCAADRPVMWDVISDAPMSTQHACARFLVPHLAETGWALFMDGDVLVRSNLCRLFEKLDRTKAVYCVKHRFNPPAGVKMDGQQQTRYARKNWSSVVVFNCDHEINRRLTLELVNGVPGRDLHAFCWLDDDLIGELSPEWNFLVGHSDISIAPKIVHFTDGTPAMPGYENVPYADEWRAQLEHWAE
jgi:lipopolysaccharide biosynthesis glycosyltransferase